MATWTTSPGFDPAESIVNVATGATLAGIGAMPNGDTWDAQGRSYNTNGIVISNGATLTNSSATPSTLTNPNIVVSLISTGVNIIEPSVSGNIITFTAGYAFNANSAQGITPIKSGSSYLLQGFTGSWVNLNNSFVVTVVDDLHFSIAASGYGSFTWPQPLTPVSVSGNAITFASVPTGVTVGQAVGASHLSAGWVVTSVVNRTVTINGPRGTPVVEPYTFVPFLATQGPVPSKYTWMNVAGGNNLLALIESSNGNPGTWQIWNASVHDPVFVNNSTSVGSALEPVIPNADGSATILLAGVNEGQMRKMSAGTSYIFNTPMKPIIWVLYNPPGTSVTLNNLNLVGTNVNGQFYDTGDVVNGSGIKLTSASNVTVSNITTNNTWGDGFEVAYQNNNFNGVNLSTVISSNVTVNNLQVGQVGREGVTLVYINGATFNECQISATLQDAVSTESDLPGIGAANVTFNNCSFDGSFNMISPVNGPFTLNNCINCHPLQPVPSSPPGPPPSPINGNGRIQLHDAASTSAVTLNNCTWVFPSTNGSSAVISQEGGTLALNNTSIYRAVPGSGAADADYYVTYAYPITKGAEVWVSAYTDIVNQFAAPANMRVNKVTEFPSGGGNIQIATTDNSVSPAITGTASFTFTGVSGTSPTNATLLGVQLTGITIEGVFYTVAQLTAAGSAYAGDTWSLDDRATVYWVQGTKVGSATFYNSPFPAELSGQNPSYVGGVLNANGAPPTGGLQVTSGVNASYQGATVTFINPVHPPPAPAFTSSSSASVTAGNALSFTVAASNASSITLSGTLPSGISFNGTTLSGTPTSGAGGSYPLIFTATNVTGTATQSFTLTVDAAPSFTSVGTINFTVGSPVSATISAQGYPIPSLTRTGTLPTGMTFVDNGNGTAFLTGTPPGSGPYSFSVTASNGYSPNATLAITLQGFQAPTISSSNTATFTQGVAGSFTLTTSAGSPTPTWTLTSGTLPTGLAFSDNGDGTASLVGTPTQSGGFSVQVDASNGVSPDATQTLTVNVNDSTPTVTGVSVGNGGAGCSFAGGVTVTITGTNFVNVSAVNFGTVPAISFTVVSATEIQAVAPAAPNGVGATVDITVTNPSGTSATNTYYDGFTWSLGVILLDYSWAGIHYLDDSPLNITMQGFTGWHNGLLYNNQPIAIGASNWFVVDGNGNTVALGTMSPTDQTVSVCTSGSWIGGHTAVPGFYTLSCLNASGVVVAVGTCVICPPNSNLYKPTRTGAGDSAANLAAWLGQSEDRDSYNFGPTGYSGYTAAQIISNRAADAYFTGPQDSARPRKMWITTDVQNGPPTAVPSAAQWGALASSIAASYPGAHYELFSNEPEDFGWTISQIVTNWNSAAAAVLAGDSTAKLMGWDSAGIFDPAPFSDVAYFLANVTHPLDALSVHMENSNYNTSNIVQLRQYFGALKSQFVTSGVPNLDLWLTETGIDGGNYSVMHPRRDARQRTMIRFVCESFGWAKEHSYDFSVWDHPGSGLAIYVADTVFGAPLLNGTQLPYNSTGNIRAGGAALHVLAEALYGTTCTPTSLPASLSFGQPGSVADSLFAGLHYSGSTRDVVVLATNGIESDTITLRVSSTTGVSGWDGWGCPISIAVSGNTITVPVNDLLTYVFLPSGSTVSVVDTGSGAVTQFPGAVDLAQVAGSVVNENSASVKGAVNNGQFIENTAGTFGVPGSGVPYSDSNVPGSITFSSFWSNPTPQEVNAVVIMANGPALQSIGCSPIDFSINATINGVTSTVYHYTCPSANALAVPSATTGNGDDICTWTTWWTHPFSWIIPLELSGPASAIEVVFNEVSWGGQPTEALSNLVEQDSPVISLVEVQILGPAPSAPAPVVSRRATG